MVLIRCTYPLPFDVTITKRSIAEFLESLKNGFLIRWVHRITENDAYSASVDLPRLPET